MEIVLWGTYGGDDVDTVSFGTENFGIPLQNLIYSPRLVICIDIETLDEVQEVEPGSSSSNFCAFDWLRATFANEWLINKTYFDLFRAVARFHMERTFSHSRIKPWESRWFMDSRATPALKEFERRRLRELEDRYGIAHGEDEDRLTGRKNEDAESAKEDEDRESHENDKDTGHGYDAAEEDGFKEDETTNENGMDTGGDKGNDGNGRSAG